MSMAFEAASSGILPVLQEPIRTVEQEEDVAAALGLNLRRLRTRRGLSLERLSRSSDVFQTDIHPAAYFGRGVFLDHATGLVVGETAMVEDNISLLQNVTLGGTGKEIGDRHPKIRQGAVIGAGAKILGNIEIGARARVAAGSVVLRPVEAGATVAGVPAKVIRSATDDPGAQSLDQIIGGAPYQGFDYSI